MAPPPTILVFDSGLGGLTVLREIVRARPDAHYVYVADDAFFPYGHHGEEEIIARVVPLVGELIVRHAPAMVVIACNTASTLVMSHLRSAYSVPFVGTELAPCFVGNGADRTDTVVLACTHYPLLLDRLTRLAPWPVDWIDPAPAIARRVSDLLGSPGRESDKAGAEMIFTSQRPHTLSRSLMPFFGGRVPA